MKLSEPLNMVRLAYEKEFKKDKLTDLESIAILEVASKIAISDAIKDQKENYWKNREQIKVTEEKVGFEPPTEKQMNILRKMPELKNRLNEISKNDAKTNN